MKYNNSLSQLSKEIPREVKLVIKGLDSEVRLAIIVALIKNGKRTFSELKELLGLNSSSLSSHLSILQDGGLVNNILEWNEKSYSYYMTTDIANAVLESLFDTVVATPQGPLEVWEKTTVSGPQKAITESKLFDLALEGQFATDAIKSVPQYTTIDNNLPRRFRNKQG